MNRHVPALSGAPTPVPDGRNRTRLWDVGLFSKANVAWALGYSKQPDGTWVKQWVVKSITPLNGEPPIHVLTSARN